MTWHSSSQITEEEEGGEGEEEEEEEKEEEEEEEETAGGGGEGGGRGGGGRWGGGEEEGEEEENSGINLEMDVGSWPVVRQDENVPRVLRNPTALFCIVLLPPFLRKGIARLHWGKTAMQSPELNVFPVLGQGHCCTEHLELCSSS